MVDTTVNQQTADAVIASCTETDIGHFLDKARCKLTDVDVRTVLLNRWMPSDKAECPVSYHNKGGKLRPRTLGLNHFDSFKWLAVSRLHGFCGAWCAFCTMFKTSFEGGGRAGFHGGSGNQVMGALVNRPLTNFSDLTGREGCLELHQQTQFHKACTVRAAEFLRCAPPDNASNDVRNLISQARMQEILRNRSALKTVIETVQFCALQNIPLRGHRDDGPLNPSGCEPPFNDGNFRALLRFRVRAGDNTFREHLGNAPKNAQYTSKTIQNELLRDMTDMVISDVINDVNAAGMWTVLADETTDIAKTEQLAIVVRYVSTAPDGVFVVKEEPVAVLDLIESIKQLRDSQKAGDTGVPDVRSNDIGSSSTVSTASSQDLDGNTDMTVMSWDSEEEPEEVRLTGVAVGESIQSKLLGVKLSMSTLVMTVLQLCRVNVSVWRRISKVLHRWQTISIVRCMH